MGRQFWLGPHRAGQTVRFWADFDVIHLSIAGARVKSLRSHLSVADLAQLAQQGAIEEQERAVGLLLLGNGAVFALRFERSLTAEMDDEEQPDAAGARRRRTIAEHGTR